MNRITNRRPRGQGGFVVSAELMLIATLLVIGLIPGLSAVRVAVVTELADVGDAIGSVSQSYQFSGIAGHHAAANGSLFEDEADTCDQPDGQGTALTSRCIQVCGVGPGATANSAAAPENADIVPYSP